MRGSLETRFWCGAACLGTLLGPTSAPGLGTQVAGALAQPRAPVLAPPRVFDLQEDPPRFLFQFGSFGDQPGLLGLPWGMDTDAQGNLYVNEHQRIEKFSPGGRSLMQFALHGAYRGNFQNSADVALDEDGNVYVADVFRILVFGPGGSLIRVFDQNYYFRGAYSVEFALGRLYVLDYSHDLVRMFDAYGQRPGSPMDEFRVPYPGKTWVVAVGPAGDIYLLSTSQRSVTHYDWTAHKVGEWGSQGSGPGQFDFPVDLAVDASGNVYVVDRFLARVQKFTANGEFLSMWGSQGHGEGQFDEPSGIAVSPQGTIYVCEIGNARIQAFGYAVQVQPTTWSGMKAKFR